MRLAAALLVLLAARPAAADCATEADRLRAHLESAAPRVRRWNTGWAIAFGAVAAGQFALAATHTNPLGPFDEDYKETLYVGAGKATLGMLSRIVTPVRVSIPPPVPDRCADLVALRGAVKKLAATERNAFWLTHLGGLAVNLTGAAILWHRRSFTVGAVSFLISFPVGSLSAYTLPRRTWHLYRDESPAWSVASDLGAGAP